MSEREKVSVRTVHEVSSGEIVMNLRVLITAVDKVALDGSEPTLSWRFFHGNFLEKLFPSVHYYYLPGKFLVKLLVFSFSKSLEEKETNKNNIK